MLDGQVTDKAGYQGNPVTQIKSPQIGFFDRSEPTGLFFDFPLTEIFAGGDQFMFCDMQGVADRGNQGNIRIRDPRFP